MCSITSFAHSDSFTSSFPVLIPFVCFSSLIAMAKTSKVILNKSGKSGHPCLVPDLRGNACINCRFVIYGLYYVEVFAAEQHVEVCSLYAHFLESFLCKWVLNFVKSFFCICWNDHMVFILRFVGIVYHIDLQVLKKPFIHGINPTWSWCMIPLIYYWIQFASILLSIFVSMFISDIDF